MNSVVQTQRSITIGYGPSFAKTEFWRELRTKLIVPTEIVSLATAQRYNPALILLDHYLLRDIDFARWSAEFPEAVFLCTDSLDIDADLVLTHSLPHRQTVKILEMACYQWVLKSDKTESEFTRKRNDIFLPESAKRDAQPYPPPAHHSLHSLPASPSKSSEAELIQ